MVAAVPDGADGVEHPARRQIVGIGGNRGAGRGSVWITALQLGEQAGPGGPMDGAVDATAATECLIRRVRDGVNSLGGDVAARKVEPPLADDDAVRHPVKVPDRRYVSPRDVAVQPGSGARRP